MRVAQISYSLLTVILVAAGAAAQATKCTCGPDFCPSDPQYPAKLAAKKASMVNHGYPTDLIALMDKDGACVARVERAPDVFTIKMVKPDGSWSTIPWTKQDEVLAKQEVTSGKLREFYEFNVSKAFSCCGDPKFDERSDWDNKLELNLRLAIKCSKSGSSASCGRVQ
jgi:hypothetical protein